MTTTPTITPGLREGIPMKLRKNEVLFLGDDGEPFGALSRNGVFCGATRLANGKVRFSYASSLVENKLGIATATYAMRVNLGERIAEKLFEKPVNI